MKYSYMSAKAILVFFLILGFVPAKAGYVPVAVNGYNADVVANGAGAASASITADVDGAGYAFMAPTYNPSGTTFPTSFLPGTGLVNSAATPGLSFQLASYSSNNSLRIPATGAQAAGADTLDFATPVSAGEVFITGTSGSAAATVDITVIFTDGTTQAFPANTSFKDWYNGTPFTMQGLGRVTVSSNSIDNNTTNPRLYEAKLVISAGNYSKQIASIAFNKTAPGVLNIMGVSINTLCSGGPVTAQSGAATVCPGTAFTLSATGAGLGVGVTYQWQSSATGAAPWTNIASATGNPYNNPGQTTATYYRVYASCAGGTADTSAAVNVGVNPFSQCYCIPGSTDCTDGDVITNVTFAGINSSTSCSGAGYGDYTGTSALATVTQGQTYPVAVTVGNGGTEHVRIWIDFNHNGVFDASEFYNIGSGNNVTVNGNIAIPQTALTGLTRMRVRVRFSSTLGSGDACYAGFTYGETEDYNITINPMPGCVTPAAPTALILNGAVNSVSLSYTAPAPAPSKYLIVRTSGAALNTSPVNGTVYTAGTALGNGTIVYVGTATSFTDNGLTQNTSYTYTIFPLNDNCTGQPFYNTTSPLTGTVMTRVPMAFTWTATSGTGDWTTAANWTPARTVPDVTDTLYFTNGGTPTANNIPAQTVAKIGVASNTNATWNTAAGNTITISNSFGLAAGSTLNMAGSNGITLAFTGTATSAIDGTLNLSGTGTCTYNTSNAITAVSGTINVLGASASVSGGSTTSLIFTGTGVYQHGRNGGTIPTADYNAGSNVNVTGIVGTSPTPPAVIGGNLTWNCTAQTIAPATFSSTLTTIGGTFNMVNSGTGTFQFGTSPNVAIAGLSTISGGTLNMNGGTVNMNGGLSITGGTIFGASASTINVTGTTNQTGGLITASSGTANVLTMNLKGDFTQAAAGKVTHTGTGSLNFVFNGTAAQTLTQNGLDTGIINYRVNNTGGLNLTTTLNINKGATLTLSNAGTNIPAGTVNFNATNTTLVYNSTAGSQAANTTEWPAANGPVNVTINNTNSLVTVPFSRTIGGTLTMTAGDIDLGANTLTLGTAAATPGTLSYTAGNIRLTTGSFIRWYGTTGLPTAPGTSIGFYPVAYASYNRNVAVYFNNATALSAGGSIAVAHTNAAGVTTGLSVADGAYTINNRTNASWSFATANGIALGAGNSLGMRLTGVALLNTTNPANLRVMQPAAVVGTHVAGSGVSAQRSSMSIADLASPYHIGAAGADMGGVYIAVNTGNWSTGSTWDIGTAPTIANEAYINPGVTVTVDAATNAARSLSISAGGTLTANANTLTIDSAFANSGTVNINGGTLLVNGSGTNGIANNASGVFTLGSGTVTLGPAGGSLKPFVNSGILTVAGGVLNINGNLNCTSGSITNQSGGDINVDGNAGGVAANSVANGTAIVSFKSPALNLTGGTIKVIDPHASTTQNNTVEYNATGNVELPATHTFIFGDGVSTDAGGNSIGLLINNRVTSGSYLSLGTVIVNSGTGSNKYVRNQWDMGVSGNMTINNGGEFYPNDELYLRGNLIVNTGGTFTSNTSYTLYFAKFNNSSGSVTDGSGAQSISGSGTFRNSQTTSTANFYSIRVQNAGGLTINQNASFSGTVTFSAAAAGPSRITMPGTTVLSEISGAGVSGPSQTNGWVVGRYQKAAGTGGINHTYPVGDTGTYAPVNINGAAGSVTAAGAIWASTTKLDHPGINTSEINATKSVNRYYTLQPVNGIAFGATALTATFNWAASDVDAGSVPANFKGGYYNGTTWTYPTTGTATATSLQLTGLGASLAGDYQVGERCGQINITAQPTNVAACAGSPFTFSLTLADTSGVLYQWRKGGTNINGATGKTYTITSPVAADAGTYDVVLTSACPSVASLTSGPITLTVNEPPTITAQPAATQTICEGSPVTFTVTATGTGLSYQWMKGATPINGATASSYSINNVAPGDAGTYSVVISGTSPCVVATSANADLVVNPLPLTITAASTTTFCAGGSVQLDAPTTPVTLTYQWYKDNAVIGSATAAAYIATTTGSYTAIITNTANGCSDTSNAIGVVNAAPAATVTPSTPVAICQGDSVVLKATNPGGLTFQWTLNNTPITNATLDSFVVYNTGSYRVIVSTVGGSGCATTSAPTDITVNPLPVATATAAGATTFCQGGSVTIDANTGTGLTYQWKKDGTNISGATSASYSATATGSYTVTVTNSNGCKNTSAAVAVTVNPVPAATATAASAVTFCQGGSVTINANTGTGLTYEWLLGGSPIGGATTSSYTANASGSYAVKVTNGFNCSTTSAAVTVTVNPLPTATASPAGPIAICAGSSTTLSANTGTGLTYQWQNNGTSISGATGATYTATAAGSYTVIVKNANNCQKTSNAVTVTVNPLPAATITPPGPASICAGESVTLNANTGTGLTHQWTQNNTDISGATVATYTANATGAYRVKVTDGNNCTATSAPFNLTVNPLPVGSITYNTPLSFCEGAAVILTVDPSTGLRYQWKKDGTNIVNDTTFSHVADESGVYTVQLTNAFNCTSTTNALTVTVFPKPLPVITAAGFLLSTGTFSTYQWYLNNTPIAGATAQTHLAVQNGAYSVKVTDANGCDNTSEQFFVNTVSVNNPGITKGSIKVYPNPASAIVHIEAPISVNVYVRNMEGKTVMMQKNARDLDISPLANGLYMLMVTDTKGNMLMLEKLSKIGN